jgi:hypothetical protein
MYFYNMENLRRQHQILDGVICCHFSTMAKKPFHIRFLHTNIAAFSTKYHIGFNQIQMGM